LTIAKAGILDHWKISINQYCVWHQFRVNASFAIRNRSSQVNLLLNCAEWNIHWKTI